MRTATILTALTASLAPAAADPAPPLPDDGEGYEHVERFIRVLEMVRQKYPDAGRVTYERLVNHALEGMLASLDKFSAFYHPETYAYLREHEREPELPGLGLTLAKSPDALGVTAVHVNSAAARAGIAAGDRILRINNEEAAPLTLKEALAMLSGPPGEEVRLRLRRRFDREEYDAALLRSVVRQPAVPDAFLLPHPPSPKIGYVRLTEFSPPAPHELETALDDLEDRGMQALVLDLRGNPGGTLKAAVAILGEFLPPSTEVVFTRGRHPEEPSPPMKTPERKRRVRDYPLAVLIDRASASASELVSGALKDLDRAVIVGQTSYGKGSVQNIVPTGAGTALRLTVATYHTPSGRTPHRSGITPDVMVDTNDDDRRLLDLWRCRQSATPDQRKELDAWTDPVLAAALKTLRSTHPSN